MVGRVMQHASCGNNMAQHRLCVCYTCTCVFSCRLSTCMYLYNISMCIKACILLPFSCQGARQHSTPGSAGLPLMHIYSYTLHWSPSPYRGRGATQLLTFPRLCRQPHTVPSLCNWAAAMFQHVQQSSESVLESLELHYIRFALLYFTFHVL